MLSVLDLVGTIGGAVLGLPGLVGIAFGMMTRKPLVALVLGAAVGVLAPVLLGGSHSTDVPITTLEMAISVVIGVLAAQVGCVIRRRGATV
ncbi:hypothetical protein [Donghicola tyrosinivorans]|uniref:Uncharacterized protein n=1 Tax=Donghicola tyrosinivorans TaxID=1652492 RepID=A0A2T0WHL6_9RHOB|nr:hypothetical protein [Donghicola tyrosinivorans]PRY86145.1 hypothetical protein CLV74_113120 [Donghicola tyrosinivorans]